MDADTPQRGFTPRELARLLRISADRVRTMIVRGELGALNLAPAKCGKPRYVILPHHLAEFERGRSAAQPKPAPRRRKHQPAGWVDYFPDGLPPL